MAPPGVQDPLRVGDTASRLAVKQNKEYWGGKKKQLNFQAVIKSAAGAASREPKSREGSSREGPRGCRSPAEPLSCIPLDLPSLDLGFLEAALAADLITA